MKDTITSALSHVFAALAGLGTFLTLHGMIGVSDTSAVDTAGASLGDVLAVILAALVARLGVWISSKVLNGGSSSGVQVLLLSLFAGTLLAGGLTACSAEQMAAVRGIPIHIGIQGPNGSVGYDSKGGLEIQGTLPDRKSGK